MMKPLTAGQRRVAALGLAAALAGLGYAALVRPLIEAHRHYDERIAELNHQLQRYARAAKDREALQGLLGQRTRMDVAKNYYLAERNPALASAELQGLLKRAVEQGRGEIISTQVVRPERSSEATVRVQVRGDIRTLHRTLYTLESGRPILFVNNLSIANSSPRGARVLARTQGVVPGKDLLITMEVSGYMRERQI